MCRIELGCAFLLIAFALGGWPAAPVLAQAARDDARRGGQAPFDDFAASLLRQLDDSDRLSWPDFVLRNGRLRIAVWPFSGERTPVPPTVANEFNAKLLAALVDQGADRYRYVAREALGEVVKEVSESLGDEDEIDAALTELMRGARAEVLVVGRLRRAAKNSVVLSYRAIRVRDGAIIAATLPRRIPVPRGELEVPRPGPSPDGPRVAEVREASPDPDVVESVQKDLAGLGYDPGPADGLLGPRTAAAIRAYQRDRGLARDGRITASLVDRLRRDSERRLAARPKVTPPPTVAPPPLEAPPPTVAPTAPVRYDPRKPYCREYQRTVRIGGRKSHGYGTACLQPDGSWKIVSSRAPAPLHAAPPSGRTPLVRVPRSYGIRVGSGYWR